MNLKRHLSIYPGYPDGSGCPGLLTRLVLWILIKPSFNQFIIFSVFLQWYHLFLYSGIKGPCMTGPKFWLAPAHKNMDHAPDKKIGLKIRTRVRSSVQWTTLSAPVNRQSVSNWGPNRPVIPSFIASFDFNSFSSLFLFFISSSFLFCLLSTSSSSFYWFSNKPIRMQYSSNRQISRLKWCWWQGYIGDNQVGKDVGGEIINWWGHRIVGAQRYCQKYVTNISNVSSTFSSFCHQHQCSLCRIRSDVWKQALFILSLAVNASFSWSSPSFGELKHRFTGNPGRGTSDKPWFIVYKS